MKKLISKYLFGGYSIPATLSYKWQDNVSKTDRDAINKQLVDNKRKLVAPLADNAANEARSENILKLKSLLKLGYYDKNIDGVWGRGSRAGEKMATDAGYTWNGKEYVLPNAPSNAHISSPLNAAVFALTMYKRGTSPINYIGNALTTVIPAFKAFVRNESDATYHSDGTDLQIIAAIYGASTRPKDADERLRNGETLRYNISNNDKGGYAWRNINGNKDVREGGLLKNVGESGSHTLGRFQVVETPGGLEIIDTYDFNDEGESGERVANGTANTYDVIRALMPNKISNPDYKGLKINWKISRNAINNYIAQEAANASPKSTVGYTAAGLIYNKANGNVDYALGALKKGGKLNPRK